MSTTVLDAAGKPSPEFCNRPKRASLQVVKTHPLNGVITAPASKSYTHRAIIIGSMDGRSSIINPLISGDNFSTLNAWREMGSDYFLDLKNNKVIINGFNGHPKLKGQKINVGQAGTLLRFALAVSSLGKGDVTFEGEGTLSNRPNAMIVDPLRQLGVKIDAQGIECLLPITVHGTGYLKGNHIKVKGDISSQGISALLIISSLSGQDMTIEVDGKIVSKPYIDITIDVLKQAGIKVISGNSYQSFTVKHAQAFKPLIDYRVHGDYSSSAFLIAAACLVESDVTIKDLVKDKQGDQRIIDYLEEMGATIERGSDYVRVRGPYKLHGVEISCRDTPDLVPVMTAVAALAKGKSRIYDVSHLKYKESDRLISPVQELAKLGVRAQSNKDEIIIEGSIPKGGIVSSCLDHRIAMALTLIGLKTGDLIIKDAQCISKSYPGFVEDLQSLGASLVEYPEPKNSLVDRSGATSHKTLVTA